MYHIGLIYCTCRLDATLDDGSFGRLCNDESKVPSAKIKVIEEVMEDPIRYVPHLCLFSLRDMVEGEEIRYNYGKGLKFFWRVCTMFFFMLAIIYIRI